MDKEKIEIGVNLATVTLVENIVKLVKDSGLPYVNKRYAVTDVLNMIRKQEDNAIKQELQDYEKKIEELNKEKEENV